MSDETNVIESRAVGFLWLWEKPCFEDEYSETNPKKSRFIQSEGNSGSVTNKDKGIWVVTVDEAPTAVEGLDYSAEDLLPSYDDPHNNYMEEMEISACEAANDSVPMEPDKPAEQSDTPDLCGYLQCRLMPCSGTYKHGWGLYRLDIVLLKGDENISKVVRYTNAMRQITKGLNGHLVTLPMGELDMVQVSLVNTPEQNIIAHSSFFPSDLWGEKSSKDDYFKLSIDVLPSGELQISGNLDYKGSNEQGACKLRTKLINYMADEYAELLERMISMKDIEANHRRVEHIRHSIDRHMPLIERLHAMQRRLSNDYHAFRNWRLQLRIKVSELFHIIVDSINDLAMELEQNNRCINNTLDQVLSSDKKYFDKLGDDYPDTTDKPSAVKFLSDGGVYRKKIENYRQSINTRLSDDRSLLDRVGSLVDTSDQRTTTKGLNRLQTWGAMFAIIAIFTSLFGQYDSSNLLVAKFLALPLAMWSYIASYAGLLVYALHLEWKSKQLTLTLGTIASLSSIALVLALCPFGHFEIIGLSKNQIEDMYFLQALIFMFVALPMFLVLRQKDLTIWMSSRKDYRDKEDRAGELPSILKLEGQILDVYETLFQKQTGDPEASGEKVATDFKKAWTSLANSMDSIDAERHKTKFAEGAFTEQINRIRDEVLVARAIAQCMLRLPEKIYELKNQGIAEHVMLQANIDFDPIPNTQKIDLIDKGRLLPAYLPSYSLDEYVRSYLDKETNITKELGGKIYEVLLQSICIYQDGESLKILNNINKLKLESNTINLDVKYQLHLHLGKHLSRDFIDIFQLFIRDCPIVYISWKSVSSWLEKGEEHAQITSQDGGGSKGFAREIMQFILDKYPNQCAKDEGIELDKVVESIEFWGRKVKNKDLSLTLFNELGRKLCVLKKHEGAQRYFNLALEEYAGSNDFHENIVRYNSAKNLNAWGKYEEAEKELYALLPLIQSLNEENKIFDEKTVGWEVAKPVAEKMYEIAIALCAFKEYIEARKAIDNALKLFQKRRVGHLCIMSPQKRDIIKCEQVAEYISAKSNGLSENEGI